MTTARSRLVDTSLTRWYHCVSRCVRRAFLLAEGEFDRKQWIENRLEELSRIFSVSVAGFSVLDNHLHVLLRLDPAVADSWSNEDVVRRWGRLFPPRDKARQPLPVTQQWVEWRLKDEPWVAQARRRLQSLSWFMKCLKEPLSRLVNRQEQTRGAFFESRFKSVAVLDEEALLATCAYIDLNPVAASIAATPEQSEHTSFKQRVENAISTAAGSHAAQAGGITAAPLDVGRSAANVAPEGAGNFAAEGAHWLCPIEDRRGLDSEREGMLAGLSLASYMRLVDYTGRMFRHGKAAISADLAGIFERLGSSAEAWEARLNKLSGGRLLGRFFAGRRERLRQAASHFGVHHLANLGGCPAG